MQKPKKPVYSEKKIELAESKINEYNNLDKDEEQIKKFIENNLSDKAKAIKSKTSFYLFVKEKIPNIVFWIFLIIADIVATMYYVNAMGYTELKKQICFFFLFLLVGYVPLGIVSYIVLIPIKIPFNHFVSNKIDPLLDYLDQEISYLRELYHSKLLNNYSEYFKIQKELNDYHVESKKYQEYCLRTQKEFWYSLDGHAFEQEIAKIFRKEGFEARVSKVGADGGVDIIVSKNNKRYAVQCKAHTSKISESVARDLYGVLHSRNFDGGYLITLNGTSSKTKEFCKKNKDKPITIWTISDILKKTK